MPRLALGPVSPARSARALRALYPSLAALFLLAACIADPQPSPEPSGPRTAAKPVLHLRVALPPADSACRIDSAVARARAPGTGERETVMAITDSGLAADLADLDPVRTEIEVLAFSADGALAYRGAGVWEPSIRGSAVTVVLGRVGKVRLDADFGRDALE